MFKKVIFTCSIILTFLITGYSQESKGQMPLLYAVNSDGQPDRIISNAHYALRKSLIAPATFPPIGEVKALCMIVDYPDNSLKPSEATFDHWNEIFNGSGTWDQDRRSLQGVYLDQSFDKLKVTTTILWPPYRMKKNFADYNQDTYAQMIEAIKHYDPTFDFSPYDGNNDGYVDILLLDLQGKIVKDFSGEWLEAGVHTIDLKYWSNLPHGCYIV